MVELDDPQALPLENLIEHKLLSFDPEAAIDYPVVLPALEAEIERCRASLEEMAELKLTLGGTTAIGELASALRLAPEPVHAWLVAGVIRRGGVTLVTGREKLACKSTWLGSIVASGERGEPTVFGGEGEAFRTIWVTEEPTYSLREKADDFDLQKTLFIQLSEWHSAERPLNTFIEKLALVGELALAAGYAHIIIDPLARIAGVHDEAGNELGERVDEASRLAQHANLAVTLIHHNNKGTGRQAIDRIRGSTSLTAAVDVIIQIDPAGKGKTRKRKLTAIGRVRETNWERTIELCENNRSYRLVTDAPAPVPTAVDMLRKAGRDKTAKEVLEENGHKAPTKYAQEKLHKELGAHLDSGLVIRTGEQRTGYRYSVADGGG